MEVFVTPVLKDLTNFNMKNQTYLFEKESKRYVSTYLNQEEAYIYKFSKFIKKKDIKNIIDIGCGNANFLNKCSIYYEKSICTGVEPNADVIQLLKNKFPKLNFVKAFCHNLKMFKTNTFDLTVIYSVLHWVGRDEYLQSIGELIRITDKYLIIMDFVASEDYKTPYSHKEGLFTYKQDFDKIVMNSGVMDKLEEEQFYYNDKTKKLVILNSNDLLPFHGNRKNYDSRKIVVYKKNYNHLNTQLIQDF
jgi:ubiquinone/menaquinone biosynthesis C-methylase UbiE